ncbi:MAG: tail fiber domain-containing protein [Acidobacteriota bacterium]
MMFIFSTTTHALGARAGIALLCVFLLVPAAGWASSATCSNPVVEIASGHLLIQAEPGAVGALVTLRDADGRVVERTVEVAHGAEVPLTDLAGEALPDGLVHWQVRFGAAPVGPRPDAASDRVLPLPWMASGAFSMLSGQSIPLVAEEGSGLVDELMRESAAPASGSDPASVSADGAPTKVRLYIEDVVVDGNLCAGTGCVSSESFGDDVLRLKDTRIRQHFWDTSTSTYPTRDWRFLINDPTTGGANYFALEDIDGSRVPLKIEAAAPTDSLRVSAQGRLGIRTATPAKDIHVLSGDSPTLRLQQDTSSGFAAQGWDVAGNEANFFVRDVDVDTIPFRVRPGAPDLAVVVGPNGDFGLGMLTPLSSLDILRTDGTARILVREQSTTAGNTVMFEAASSAGNIQTFFRPSSGSGWKQNFRGTDFRLDSQEDATNEMVLDTAGNLTVSGTVSGSSDRSMKEDFLPVDARQILKGIETLPITTWKYRADAAGVRHLGPVSQDFHAAFGFGPDDRHIAPQDTASVALVGVQALQSELKEKEERVRALEAANADLLRRLEALEAKLAE